MAKQGRQVGKRDPGRTALLPFLLFEQMILDLNLGASAIRWRTASEGLRCLFQQHCDGILVVVGVSHGRLNRRSELVFSQTSNTKS